MRIETAVNILKVFNRWRRGEDIEPMLSPTDIGIAIDTVVDHLDGVINDFYCLEHDEETEKCKVQCPYCERI